MSRIIFDIDIFISVKRKNEIFVRKIREPFIQGNRNLLIFFCIKYLG